jgi:hypothetical protein
MTLPNITAEAIAEHKKAIFAYTDAIAELIPLHRGNPVINRQINQFVSILRALIQEWKEMNEICNISDSDRDSVDTNECDRVLPRA